MFITSLKPDEGLEVPGPAEVTVLSIRGSHVRIGIAADRSVRIRRFKVPTSSAPPSDPPIDPEVGADLLRSLTQGIAK